MIRKLTFFTLLLIAFSSLNIQCKEDKVMFSIGLSYENIPGLLGNNGHIKLEFDVKHPSLAINTVIKPLIKELNTVCDYNPEKNNRLTQQISQLEKRHNTLNSKNNDVLAKKIIFLHNQQETNAITELSDENDPDVIAIKDMIKQIREKNGY